MKSKKKKGKKKETPIKPPKKEVEAPKSDEFDFGGLPDRDLKKNLGCG